MEQNPPSPVAGAKDGILTNYTQITQTIKAASQSLYGFKAQEGKNIPFLTPKQAAQQIGISVKTLERMRKDGSGPPFTKLNKKIIRYPIIGLEAWLSARMSSPNV